LNNNPQIEAEVKEFFNEFVEAYPKEDLNRYLKLFSQDEKLVMFGTAEKWLGWEEYKDAPAKEKERFEEISLEYDWLRVNSLDNVAWIASEVKVTLKVGIEIIKIPARLTGVVVKKDSQWKIVQGHISVYSN
jgi:ketosteroid isomerase-like protein